LQVNESAGPRLTHLEQPISRLVSRRPGYHPTCRQPRVTSRSGCSRPTT
jgi:hypothetical protein